MVSKRILALLVCGIAASAMLTACGDSKTESSGSGTSASEPAAPANVDILNYTAPEKGDKIVEMDIRDYGVVKFRLFPEYAEKGVENFIGLAEDGYYDGLTFHRIINDFMIQGGDPLGTGQGGKSLWGSSFDGGTDAHLGHCPGAVAYANSNGPATNTSQFYIVTGVDKITDDLFSAYEGYGYSFSDKQKEFYAQYGGTPFLDGNYTVFGQVIDGLDIIFKIQKVGTDANDKPLNDVIVNSVKITEYNGEPIKWYLSDYDYADPMKQPVDNFTPPEEGDDIICMNIKDYGTVKIRLFPEIMAKASENFFELAKKGYYDGLTFHRVISDFMIQGGDPLGNGTGGECIWGDKFDGGKYYNLIHAAGAIAYANSGQYGNYTASDGSQFYIVTGEPASETQLASYNLSDDAKRIYSTIGGTPYLDGGYTVFGQVIDGLDIIFKIQNVDTDENDKPLEDVIIESVTVEKYDGSPIRWYMTDYDEEATTEDTSEEDETEDTSEESEEETSEAAEEETEAEAAE